MSQFNILKKDKNSKARLGLLKTAHGTIQTPSYVMVGTYGQIRHLSARDIKKTKTQLIIANTFHLWDETLPWAPSQACDGAHGKKTFLTRKLGLNIPTMTDSGGFQVLSLAFNNKYKIGKFIPLEVAPPRSKGLATKSRARLLTGFISDDAKTDKDYRRSKIKITEKGVHFKHAGKWKFLSPKLSMKIQEKIGADIIFAFDHITSPLDSYTYNKKALELTNKWAKICLKHKSQGQALFGIVQGGLFKDLRIKSAKSIGAMSFDGFGIGGSYTKKQIAKVLKWVIPHLPEEKPRHLLGVGKIQDVFEAVENGVDTFDCVIPTREARHGRLYTKKGTIDIRRGYFSKDKNVIEKECKCPTCSKKISKSKIRALLKNPIREQNAKGQRYCLMHNMWFFNNLLEDIRDSIAKGKFKEFKKKFLRKFI
ncbi:MAG: tRNA guanosine(34) transglycosylase Tgt [bacterium]|nr:tRNA guanosine(34) transglycosylase Tgt [bacterium]